MGTPLYIVSLTLSHRSRVAPTHVSPPTCSAMCRSPTHRGRRPYSQRATFATTQGWRLKRDGGAVASAGPSLRVVAAQHLTLQCSGRHTSVACLQRQLLSHASLASTAAVWSLPAALSTPLLVSNYLHPLPTLERRPRLPYRLDQAGCVVPPRHLWYDRGEAIHSAGEENRPL